MSPVHSKISGRFVGHSENTLNRGPFLRRRAQPKGEF